jgi:release factor glutamine methyltransferase
MPPFQQLIDALTPRYGPSEAASIARIVLEDAFGVRSVKDFELPIAAKEHFRAILARLNSGEPVQYVLSQADFFGYTFKVDRRVLIPRQETEELVALALELLKGQKTPSVLDIGTGSGCIAITIKKKLTGAAVFALDVSPDALDLAVENALRLNAKVHFELQDVLDPGFSLSGRMFDMIVSNPPYIPHSEAAIMPGHVKNHEPGLALFVPEEDALVFYRRIGELALEGLRSGGWLLFEINEFRAEGVAHVLRQLGYGMIDILPDLSGAMRMARAQKQG